MKDYLSKCPSSVWCQCDYFTAPMESESLRSRIVNIKHVSFFTILHRAASDSSPIIAEDKEQTGKHQNWMLRSYSTVCTVTDTAAKTNKTVPKVMWNKKKKKRKEKEHLFSTMATKRVPAQ